MARAGEPARRAPRAASRDAGQDARRRAPRGGRRGPGLASTEDRWQHDALTELVAALEDFSRPTGGLVEDVERRVAFASTIRERSSSGPVVAALWEEACASIGDPDRCPGYGGMQLTPQLGLVPLGQDPRSGLWEFAHLQTGEPPTRDPATGELVLRKESGLVLILLPDGVSVMGAQDHDPGGRRFFAEIAGDERPVHEIELEPFFLSKYEMTQAQWRRCTGSNPSQFFARDDKQIYGTNITWLNPVEGVSWEEADRLCHQLGLELPTEAQWEYAARAGTETPWWTGADERSVEGAANLADGGTRRKSGPDWWSYDEWLEDGHAAHAPVDAFEPNPFGFHGIIGNVKEFCRDRYAQYTEPFEPRTGERHLTDPDVDQRLRVARGGGFSGPARVARSSVRDVVLPDYRDADQGLRPARRLRR